MISLRFYGAVKKHYHRIDMNCDTPAQGLRLLMAQNHAFKKSMLHGKFRLRVDGVDIDTPEKLAKLDQKYPDGTVIQVCQLVHGKLAGLASIGIGTWIAIGVSVAAVAFSLFMSRNMKLKTSAEAAQDGTIDNNSYTSAENRVGQGKPIPILLGEMVCGSNVISLGIDTSNAQDFEDLIS